MTWGNRGASIMGCHNRQASLISRDNNGRNISSVHTHIRAGRTKAVTEPAPNTTCFNEVDTNADTCCLGKNVIPIAYTNQSAGV